MHHAFLLSATNDLEDGRATPSASVHSSQSANLSTPQQADPSEERGLMACVAREALISITLLSASVLTPNSQTDLKDALLFSGAILAVLATLTVPYAYFRAAGLTN